jgi:hypothetical protein
MDESSAARSDILQAVGGRLLTLLRMLTRVAVLSASDMRLGDPWFDRSVVTGLRVPPACSRP